MADVQACGCSRVDIGQGAFRATVCAEHTSLNLAMQYDEVAQLRRDGGELVEALEASVRAKSLLARGEGAMSLGMDVLASVGDMAAQLGCVPVQTPPGFQLTDGWGRILRVWRDAEVPAGWHVLHMDIPRLLAHLRSQPTGRIVYAVPAVGGFAVLVATAPSGARPASP